MVVALVAVLGHASLLLEQACAFGVALLVNAMLAFAIAPELLGALALGVDQRGLTVALHASAGHASTLVVLCRLPVATMRLRRCHHAALRFDAWPQLLTLPAQQLLAGRIPVPCRARQRAAVFAARRLSGCTRLDRLWAARHGLHALRRFALCLLAL
ncbi:hypothetical protein [Luteimonas sp. SDU82]|uniref:hypothetical protein n=1 Tax=Luteimonas sp. SDU82 TaxID=3422592 RepID=UPI003EBA4122